MNINRKTLKKLDVAIFDLVAKLEDNELKPDERNDIENRMEVLIDYRERLTTSLKENVLLPIIGKGVFGLAAILLVLNYEKAEVITGKAFGLAMRMND